MKYFDYWVLVGTYRPSCNVNYNKIGPSFVYFIYFCLTNERFGQVYHTGVTSYVSFHYSGNEYKLQKKCLETAELSDALMEQNICEEIAESL